MITGMPRIAIAVQDFEATLHCFREQLGMPVVDISDQSVDSLGAKLAMCIPKSGSNVELMCPANPDAPLSQSLQRFLDRRGEGLFALMLEAPDPNKEAEELLERGLNVLPLMAGAGGRDVHPNSTHGVLIRIYPVNSFQGQAAGSADQTGVSALSGITRVIIAVHDLDSAVTAYGDRFALGASEVTVDPERGVRSALVQPPTGGQIELLSVENEQQPFAHSVASHLKTQPEGMYALVLESADPSATAEALQSRGLKVTASADSHNIMETDRSSTFGVLLRIEPKSV